ncbi:hypothetical protein [Streptomyces sp. NBC_00645]|uniref:hypothetical protein n=1 Tax=Streptomyces sp. NBC_00645 TaxID=2975795 RepID=UPI003244393D
MLSDQFDDGVLDPVLWGQSYGDPAQLGGRLLVPCTAGYAGARTVSAYSLAWSQVAARVYPPAAGGATSAACSLLVLSGVGGTDAGFLVDQAQSAMGLYLREGYADGAAVYPTYDPAAHAWLRLREDAGLLYWEASPDGLAWSVLRTAASPGWVVHTDLSLLFEAHRDAGTPDHAELDSLNTPRPGRIAAATRTSGTVAPLQRSGPTLSGG